MNHFTNKIHNRVNSQQFLGRKNDWASPSLHNTVNDLEFLPMKPSPLYLPCWWCSTPKYRIQTLCTSFSSHFWSIKSFGTTKSSRNYANKETFFFWNTLNWSYTKSTNFPKPTLKLRTNSLWYHNTGERRAIKNASRKPRWLAFLALAKIVNHLAMPRQTLLRHSADLVQIFKLLSQTDKRRAWSLVQGPLWVSIDHSSQTTCSGFWLALAIETVTWHVWTPLTYLSMQPGSIRYTSCCSYALSLTPWVSDNHHLNNHSLSFSKKERNNCN